MPIRGSSHGSGAGRALLAAISCAVGLSGCGIAREGGPGRAPDIDPIRYTRDMSDLAAPRSFVRAPSPERFSVCWGNTCRKLAVVDLSGGPWGRVRAAFTPAAPDAEGERAQIAQAIARIETEVGARTGTWRDRGGNSEGRGEDGQMDCVDEANNSTVYLDMLQNDGLLRWHRVGSRISRGLTRLLPPHFTATIEETATGARFAVDSWFRDNGEAPYIVPLEEWRRGWTPEPSSAASNRGNAE